LKNCHFEKKAPLAFFGKYIPTSGKLVLHIKTASWGMMKARKVLKRHCPVIFFAISKGGIMFELPH